MSTRSNIIIHSEIESKFCVLYHHCDGYPEGVGVHLCDLLASVGFLNFENTRSRIQEDSDYETTDGIHGDIEYLYVVLADSGKVLCFKANNWDGDRFGQAFKSERESGNGIKASFLGDLTNPSDRALVLKGGKAMDPSQDIPDLKTFLSAFRAYMEE